MKFDEQASVVGSDGASVGTLLSISETDDPPSLEVELDHDGRLARIPLDLVVEDASSAERIVVEISASELARNADHHATGSDPVQKLEDGGTVTIPLVEEELVATTREAEQGRVVIRKRVETVPYDSSIDVSHDEIEVERVPMDQELEEIPSVRYEDDSVIVPVFQEVLVVEKHLRLVEEVRVTKRRVSDKQEIHEELKREVVEVIEEGPESGA